MKTRTRVAAFTLVELMFALAIVAVLTVAGASLFHWGRLKAGIAVSTRNLRQLVTANLNYSADHEGYFCPAQEPRNLKRWHGSRRTVNDDFEPEGGFLTPYFGKDQRLETCPLLLRELKGTQSFEDGAGGYGYNATYLGGRPGDIYSPTSVRDVEVPYRTVMFATTAFSREQGVQEYPFVEPWFAPSERGDPMWELQPSLHFRADGKAIVAWCDGHITLEAPAPYKDTNFYGGNNERDHVGWFGPEDRNGYWNPASPIALEGKISTIKGASESPGGGLEAGLENK